VIRSKVAVFVLMRYRGCKSECVLHALRNPSIPQARVIREGEVVMVAAHELVSGDVIPGRSAILPVWRQPCPVAVCDRLRMDCIQLPRSCVKAASCF
jgi:hypothetical protein